MHLVPSAGSVWLFQFVRVLVGVGVCSYWSQMFYSLVVLTSPNYSWQSFIVNCLMMVVVVVVVMNWARGFFSLYICCFICNQEAGSTGEGPSECVVPRPLGIEGSAFYTRGPRLCLA